MPEGGLDQLFSDEVNFGVKNSIWRDPRRNGSAPYNPSLLLVL
jgi:hypothetical protein